MTKFNTSPPLFSGHKQILNPVKKATEVILGEDRTGLVGYWNDDGKSATTWLDQADGHLNNGTIYGAGTPPSATPGALGYTFDGVDDYVDVGTNLNGDGATHVSAFITLNTSWGQAGSIVAKGGGDNYGFWVLIAGDKKPKVVLVHNNGGVHSHTLVSSTILDTNKEYLISAGWDGNNILSLYINGILTDSMITSSGAMRVGWNSYIGSIQSYASFFHGSIDEVRIYNRALGADEINYLYQKYRIKFGV